MFIKIKEGEFYYDPAFLTICIYTRKFNYINEGFHKQYKNRIVETTFMFIKIKGMGT